MARKYIIAGNWKMYKTIAEATAFVDAIATEVANSDNAVYLAVPYTAIRPASEKTANTNVVIGAQNMNDADEGAFTGEIAANMLIEAGAQFVVIGHSERRAYFNEDNAFINRKIKKALSAKIQPILCVGETLEDRENNKTEEVLRQQLPESLADLTAENVGPLVIAYEPVWAIGTGKTATVDVAQETHVFCRSVIKDVFGDDVAQKITILYGGSVKPENVKELMAQNDIDGALVGGAALQPESFVKLVNFDK